MEKVITQKNPCVQTKKYPHSSNSLLFVAREGAVYQDSKFLDNDSSTATKYPRQIGGLLPSYPANIKWGT